MTPTISVIIPVYNMERYLRRCLDSVLNQTYTNWEAICVNDGSLDNSHIILEEYARKDSRFKIVDKKNGGLSDARNVGMSHSSGEYLMFLDSDDLIHPQTMEIAMGLAVRDGSDVVTWYKAPFFHLHMRLMAKFGLDIDSALPLSIKKRYKLPNVKGFVTDDIFAHVTEYSHNNIKHPIKHFYVWRFLFKREVIIDVPFIKGITFEDFPWWSEVMLKNPRVTITQLPFYFYFPNVKSIVRSSKLISMMYNWLTGLEYTYNLYQTKANDYQREKWEKNCMWPVIIYHIARPLKRLPAEYHQEVRTRLRALWEQGAFDNPPGKKEAYHQLLINEFINKRAK